MDVKSSTFCQTYIHWIATFGVFVLLTQVGITIGWAAPNIAKLTANDSRIPLNNDQVSWLVSLHPLGGFFGGIMGSIFIDLFGSRKIILLCLIFATIGWLCMILANSIIWLYVGRTIGGLITSMTYSCFSIYLGEIADSKIRGTLISVAASGNSIGIVAGSIAETLLSMQVSSTIYFITCVMTFVLCFWLRDTPYYLIKKSKYSSAKKSIRFYHPNCDMESEMNEVKNFVKAHEGVTFREKMHDLNSPIIRKSMFLIIILFSLPHFSGFMNIVSYMEVIMKSGKSNLIKSERFVIYANVMSAISSLLTVKLIDKIGRRVLLMIVGAGTGIFMLTLGGHFLLLNNGVDAEKLEWLPVVSILGYLFVYGMGFSSIPFAVLSEIFTENVKSAASFVGTLTVAIICFVVSKPYLPLVDNVGETFVFWMHAAFSFSAIPFAIFCLPETKGKTFQQIQNSLIKR